MLQLQPELSSWKKRYGFELVIVTSDPQDVIQRFVAENGLEEATVLLDPQNSAGSLYEVRYIPADFLVNSKGEIEGSFVGWSGENERRLRQWVTGE